MTSERVSYTQSGRATAIVTPLGEDVLLLKHLAIDEAVNGLFTIEAQVKSQREDLQASDLIGASVDFRLKLKDACTRWWNGIVTDLHEGSLTAPRAFGEARLVIVVVVGQTTAIRDSRAGSR